MKRKVLITGASGFVGYHLLLAALEQGFDVHAAVRSNSDVTHLSNLNISFTYLDYRSEQALQRKIEAGGWEYIIHAAGITKAPSQVAYNQVNADYTYNLASAAAKAGIKKMVFISSLAALGPQEDYTDDLITESKPPQPVTAYGKSKLLAEEKIRQLSNLQLTILRPTAVYGPRERDLFIIIRTIKNGLEPYIGKAPQTLSFIYAKDLAEVAVGALTSPATGDFNLSDGAFYNRYEFARFARKILGGRTLKLHIPVPVVRVIAGAMGRLSRKRVPALNKDKIAELIAPGWQISIEKAITELGFLPKYNLEQGLRHTIEWYQDNKWF